MAPNKGDGMFLVQTGGGPDNKSDWDALAKTNRVGGPLKTIRELLKTFSRLLIQKNKKDIQEVTASSATDLHGCSCGGSFSGAGFPP